LSVAFIFGSISFIPGRNPDEHVQVLEDRVCLHLLSKDASRSELVRIWPRKNIEGN